MLFWGNNLIKNLKVQILAGSKESFIFFPTNFVLFIQCYVLYVKKSYERSLFNFEIPQSPYVFGGSAFLPEVDNFSLPHWWEKKHIICSSIFLAYFSWFLAVHDLKRASLISPNYVAQNSLQIQLWSPLFCPISKRDGDCIGPRFPMILRWQPVLKWNGASNEPLFHSRFCREFGDLNNPFFQGTYQYFV